MTPSDRQEVDDLKAHVDLVESSSAGITDHAILGSCELGRSVGELNHAKGAAPEGSELGLVDGGIAGEADGPPRPLIREPADVGVVG